MRLLLAHHGCARAHIELDRPLLLARRPLAGRPRSRRPAEDGKPIYIFGFQNHLQDIK